MIYPSLATDLALSRESSFAAVAPTLLSHVSFMLPTLMRFFSPFFASYAPTGTSATEKQMVLLSLQQFLPRRGFVALKSDGNENEDKGVGRHYPLALAPGAVEMACPGGMEEGTQKDQIRKPPTKPLTATAQKSAPREKIEVREVTFSLGEFGSRASLCTVYEDWPLEDGNLENGDDDEEEEEGEKEEEEEEEKYKRHLPTARRGIRTTANSNNFLNKHTYTASLMAPTLAIFPPGSGWLCLTLVLASIHLSVLAWLLSPTRTLNPSSSSFTPVSLLAAATLLVLPPTLYLHRKDLRCLGEIQAKEWAALAVTTVLGPVLSSWLFLTGLQLTSVPVTSVLARVDTVVPLLLGSLFTTSPSVEEQQQQQQQQQFLTQRNIMRNGGRMDVISTTIEPVAAAKSKIKAIWVGFNILLLLLGASIVGFTQNPRLKDDTREGTDMDAYANETISAFPYAEGCGALVAGAVCFALTQVVIKAYLQRVPVGVCVQCRILLALPLLHALAYWQGGADAVLSIYQPLLWRHLLWYAPVFVVALNWLWLKTLSTLAALPSALPSPYRFLPLALALSMVLELTWSHWMFGSPCTTVGESVGAGLVLAASLSAWRCRGTRVEKEGGRVWREEEKGFVVRGGGVAEKEEEREKGKVGERGEKEEGNRILEEGGEEERAPGAGGRAGRKTVGRRKGKEGRILLDTNGVAPGREATLRFRFI